MELKFDQLNIVEKEGKSSNRTFMELKWDICQGFDEAMNVLIAPLWN